MIYTLYGDYVRHAGGKISISSLVQLLTYFDVSAQAIRSTVSRMKRNGLVQVERNGVHSYYSLTSASTQIIEEAATRIFHSHSPRDHWDGYWHLVTYSVPENSRHARDRLRRELELLGFGMLTNALWVSPYDHCPQVEQIAQSLGVRPHVEIFTARHIGFSDPQAIVARCWDLPSINKRYVAFIEKYRPMYSEHCRLLSQGQDLEPSQYFVNRFGLIHEYRGFAFRDPNLPHELAPADWRGNEATTLFRQYHDLLAERANAFFLKVCQNGQTTGNGGS